MRPVQVLAHKTVEEEACDARPGKAVCVAVVDVGDVGVEVFPVSVVKRQAPDGIVMRCARRQQRFRGLVPPRHEGGEVGSQRHPRRAGQRGEIDQQRGLLLAGAGQRVAEDQPPFGIGVADLDRQPLARAQHVAGAKGVPGDDVLGRGDEAMQPDLEPRAHHQPRQRQRMRRAAHVLLHQQHAACRFDIQPTRIEAYPFADHGEHGVAGVAPGEVDQARRVAARRRPPDGVDHGVILFERVPPHHFELGRMRLGELLRLGL